ncbi:MAG: domain S-box protein [Myxococcaceae bacterium]|nr:domain S-box protein [Myxococcaceae bacterium]
MTEHQSAGQGGPRDTEYSLGLDGRSVLEEAEALAKFGSWAVELETGEVFWSREARRIFGIAADAEVGVETYYSLVHPDEREAMRAHIRSAIHGSALTYDVDHRITRHDGSLCWVQGSARIARDEQGKPVRVVGVIQDATSHKRALLEQRATEERYRQIAAIVEWSNDAIIGCDVHGVITSWNRGAARLYGYEEREVLHRPIALLVPDALRGDEVSLRTRALSGESIQDYDTVRRRKDGTHVEVSLTVSPIRGAEGQILGISKIARDLTAQRSAEVSLRRAEQQLRDAQKMEAVGLLAGGIAHDFNNTLSAIVGYTELVLDNLPVGDPNRADILEVRKAGASAVSLTRQLLALSRRQVLQPRVIDLNQVVVGLERMVRHLIGANVQLSYQLASDLGRVCVDPVQVEQVIMNLVLNARDAMRGEGALTIITQNVALADGRSELSIGPGRYIMLGVRDTGHGMDEATIARIFEPFFTTKEKGKGTGLGLSTALGIVQQSGGDIELESQLERGTTFRVYLPRTERPAQSAYSLPPARLTNHSWETILLVEDEDQVRALARTALRRQGYQVLEAEQGEQALALCEQHVGNIHLLLTDVVMPRMGGRELAARAAVLRPEMKVLYMSGYAEEILPEGVLDSETALLQKPITPHALSRRVREVLDAL